MDLATRTALNRLRILIPPSLRSTEDRVRTCMILADRRFLRPLCILAPPPRRVSDGLVPPDSKPFSLGSELDRRLVEVLFAPFPVEHSAEPADEVFCARATCHDALIPAMTGGGMVDPSAEEAAHDALLASLPGDAPGSPD